jgi:uncharacterized protein
MQFSRRTRKLPITALIAGLAAASITLLAGQARGVPAQREIAWIEQLADNGDAGAQLQLGLAYRDGRYGLAPDPRTSLRWLSAAGSAGNAYAADLVGNAYATGQGVTSDTRQALHWWRIAAEGGNADAQTRLGESLRAAGDRDGGTDWLRRAADRGDARAHADLVRLYREQGLPEADLHRGDNPVAALAERVDARGLNALFAVWRTIDDNTPPVMGGESLVSQARAGDPAAEYQLGMRYRSGAWAVTQDPQQANFWLQRAAAAGNRLAAHSLANARSGTAAAPVREF